MVFFQKKKIGSMLCLLILFSLFFGLNSSIAKTVTAKGTAVIVDDDVANARDKAVSDALAKAVEMAVGSEIQSETVMQNYELLNEKIYSNSKGYISDYKVIQEKREEKLYWVTVSATVAEGTLKNDLSAIGLLMSKKKMPRIMVLISENNYGFYSWHIYSSSVNQSENVFISVLKNHGFKVVDASAMRSVIKKEAAMKALEGDNKAAAVIAGKIGADLIITGKASAQAGSRIMKSNMFSCNADINARAVRADTGEIIASGSEHAVKPHISKQAGNNEALKEAASTLANSMINSIIARWQQDVYSSNTASIFIVSTNDEEVIKFKHFLMKSIRGVKDVVIQNVSANSASLEVTLKGDAADLADELIRKKFQGRKINIVERTLNKIHISFVKNN